MAKQTNKFYNMQVNLIKNGRIYAEKVAIRNVWEKDSNIFLDIYFHRLKKSFVFDSVFIHDILDISREKSYSDINNFIADFKASADTPVTKPIVKPQSGKGLLSSIDNDIVILLFMSKAWKADSIIKNKIICDYIQNTIEEAKNLSETYLRNYISKFNPEVDDFYMALKKIKSKQPQQAEKLLREVIKVCRSDGYLHYAERMYLADIVQMLRQEGLKLPQNII